jgi:hypothetical protein
MMNLSIVSKSETDALKKIKLKKYNLWTEPMTSKKEAEFWIKRFTEQKVPYVLAQYDAIVLNSMNKKMYRRVYGLFIDMKSQEVLNAQQ